MATQIEPGRPLPNRIETEGAEPDREERRVAALQRMFQGVLEDEGRMGDKALRRIDRALRGDLDDE